VQVDPAYTYPGMKPGGTFCRLVVDFDRAPAPAAAAQHLDITVAISLR
jgi:hypothetical protein